MKTAVVCLAYNQNTDTRQVVGVYSGTDINDSLTLAKKAAEKYQAYIKLLREAYKTAENIVYMDEKYRYETNPDVYPDAYEAVSNKFSELTGVSLNDFENMPDYTDFHFPFFTVNEDISPEECF